MLMIEKDVVKCKVFVNEWYFVVLLLVELLVVFWVNLLDWLDKFGKC